MKDKWQAHRNAFKFSINAFLSWAFLLDMKRTENIYLYPQLDFDSLLRTPNTTFETARQFIVCIVENYSCTHTSYAITITTSELLHFH